MNRRGFLVTGLLLLVAGAAVAQEAKTETPRAALSNLDLARRIDEYVRPLVEAGELAGALLVARDDALVYERAFGMADYELGVPNTPATLFGVASINKPMTQIVAIRLIGKGKPGPKAPRGKWFPVSPPGQEIPVEPLLRPRAGIPPRVPADAEETVPHPAADMVEFARRKELLFAPGSQSVYSSTGYSVLAR